MKIIIGIFIFIFGTVFASFAGVIIYRVPNHMSIIKPPYFCPNCKKQIKWYDNIPLISFIMLKGKCRNCKSKIGWFSFIIELIGGLSFLLAYLAFGLSYELIFVLLLAFLFIIMAGIDYKTHYIYDLTQIIYLVIVISYSLFKVFYLKQNYISLLVGGVVGFTFFELIRVLGKLVIKQECLGFGDVILMSIGGLLLGWQNLILAVLVGSILGSIIEVTLMALKKKSREDEIAFVPYLLLGTFIALLYGTQVIIG